MTIVAKCLLHVLTVRYQCRSVRETFRHWCRIVRTLRRQLDGAELVIVPEPFLVLFRPGTASVRSGLGTFFCSGAGTCDLPYKKLVCYPWGKVGSSKGESENSR